MEKNMNSEDINKENKDTAVKPKKNNGKKRYNKKYNNNKNKNNNKGVIQQIEEIAVVNSEELNNTDLEVIEEVVVPKVKNTRTQNRKPYYPNKIIKEPKKLTLIQKFVKFFKADSAKSKN